MATHRLANALAQTGECEVTILTLEHTHPKDSTYRIIEIFPRLRKLKNLKPVRLFVIPLLLNFLDFRNFDVIHFQGDDWFFFFRRVPTIRTLNGSALREAQTAATLKRKFLQYIIYPLEHLSCKLATIPLALGPDTAKIYGISDIIDYGIDLETFHPGPKNRKPTIFYIGIWEGRKRGAFIYNEFTRKIHPRIPECTLIMACDRASIPHHPNVKAIGLPPLDQLAEAYRKAWVFAYPSVYEGFGLPYLEAMASGTAIVCSKNPGAAYLLKEGKLGEIADDKFFSKTIIKLLLNHDMRSRYEKLGTDRALNFSWKDIANTHLKIYRKATSLPKGNNHNQT